MATRSCVVMRQCVSILPMSAVVRDPGHGNDGNFVDSGQGSQGIVESRVVGDAHDVAAGAAVVEEAVHGVSERVLCRGQGEVAEELPELAEVSAQLGDARIDLKFGLLLEKIVHDNRPALGIFEGRRDGCVPRSLVVG